MPSKILFHRRIEMLTQAGRFLYRQFILIIGDKSLYSSENGSTVLLFVPSALNILFCFYSLVFTLKVQRRRPFCSTVGRDFSCTALVKHGWTLNAYSVGMIASPSTKSFFFIKKWSIFMKNFLWTHFVKF